MFRSASILLVLLLSFAGCQRDAAQWKWAEGLNARANGDLERAVELLQESVKLNPSSRRIKRQLALLLAENDQGDLGCRWCEEVLAQFPDDKDTRQVHAICLQYLGQFDQAFREYQRSIASKIDKDIVELNNLAYFRALAGTELDKAYRQIDSAIEKYQQNVAWVRMSGVPVYIRAIVSAGVLARNVGGQQYLLETLSDLIAEHEELWLRDDAQIDDLRHRQELADAADSDIYETTIQGVSNRMRNIEGSLAMLLATRSLIADGLGDQDSVGRDHAWLQKIGYLPHEIYDRLPDQRECQEAIRSAVMFLDTRGFVASKLPWDVVWTDPLGQELVLPTAPREVDIKKSSYARVLFDLDVAVAVAEINLLAVNSQLSNHVDMSPENVHQQQREADKLVAVLRYHRLSAHLRAGQQDQADADRRRIEQLGFEANASLF